MEQTKKIAAEVCGLCKTVSDGQDELIQEILGRIAGKWSLYILYVLAISGEPMRFSALSDRVQGISQKMLTQTLRLLERDGLIRRNGHYYQVPPRVEYELTHLGRELLHVTTPLWKWVVAKINQFEEARINFSEPRCEKIVSIR